MRTSTSKKTAEQTKKNGSRCFLKRRVICCRALTHAEGIPPPPPPPPPPVELSRVDVDDGSGAPDGGGGGGNAAGSSMPIFLLTTSKVLSIFLLAPERGNALRLERLLVHEDHFLPRHTLKVRRVFVQSERAEPSRDIVQYCRVEIFFVFLRTAATAAAVVVSSSCGG